ncbi:hypothetical protein B0H19DRAFT_1245824 [Mycena capillaripes]|nr:hypothetical protein B0H19DRAFT_1245824 [Mycena capillaripes]
MPTSEESVPAQVLQDIVITPPDEDVEMPMPDENEPVETLEDVVITAPDKHRSSMVIMSEIGSFEQNNHDEDSGKGEAAQSSSSQLDEKLDKDSLTPPKQKRTQRITDEEREASLKANANISTVEAHCVRCAKCLSWIKLDKLQKFKPTNWTRHEEECPAITGTRLICSQNKPVKSVVIGSISTFSRHLANKHEPGSQKSPKHPGYTSRRVKAMLSIATFFRPGPIKNDPPKPPPAAPEPRSCTHLAGGKYTEYIERAETRSMGGVSQALRSRIIRQVFMYKKFPSLKTTVPSLVANAESSVPASGNDCVASADWTENEHARVDEALRGFARWEIDFGNKKSQLDSLRGFDNEQEWNL